MDTRKKRSDRTKGQAAEQATPVEVPQEELATKQVSSQDGDRVLALICTMAAMLSPFALFLVFAEKESKRIRHVAVQSVGLLVSHIACGLVILLAGAALQPIPILGFVTTLTFWLLYLAVLAAACIARVRLMLAAWRGEAYTLPVIGKRLVRFA